MSSFFFFNDTATTEIYTLSLHDALPILNRLRGFAMNKSGRATGRYQSELQTSNLAYNDIRISDPVVYGPWLEGSSDRNRSTRFKGYRLWRKTAQVQIGRAHV